VTVRRFVSGALLVVVSLAAGAGLGRLTWAIVHRHHHPRRTATPVRVPAGTVRPGTYKATSTPPVASLKLDTGWRVDLDSPDILELSRADAPRGALAFDRVDGVFDDALIAYPQAQTTPEVSPVPSNLRAWLAANPLYDVSEARQVKLDGHAAEEFTVALRPLPADNRHFCGSTRCAFWGRHGQQLYAFFENDTSLVQVVHLDGKTIVVTAAGPTASFVAFRVEAERILATVKLRGA
jgi:hypothetical protein